MIIMVAFEPNHLDLLPHEISIMFGRGGFRPPELPDEPQINWDAIQGPLTDIQNSVAKRENGPLLNRTTREGDFKIPLIGYEQSRQVPRALLVLARRALAQEETRGAARSRLGDQAAVIAVRSELVQGLEAIIGQPHKAVLEVNCIGYSLPATEEDIEL